MKKQSRTPAYICVVLSAALTITAAKLNWGAVTPTDSFLEKPFQTITGVLFMSLIVAAILERSLALILTIAFPGEKELARFNHRKALNRGMVSAMVFHMPPKARLVSIEQTHKTLNEVQAKNSYIRLCIGFLVSIMLAASGFQILSFLVVPIETNFQTQLFTLNDIILTAGLLAGGSEGIAKLIGYLGDLSDNKLAFEQSQKLASTQAVSGQVTLPSIQFDTRDTVKTKKLTSSTDTLSKEFLWLITPDDTSL